jgi:hypothetical protein
MNRLIWLVLILILLSIGAFLLIKKQESKKSGVISADRGFTIKSIDEVEKIVIKHVKLQPLIFTKNGKSWLLEGKHPVDHGVFVNLENVLLNMRMNYIPPAASTPTILESIKNNGIQVDLYDGGDQPFKIFYIGSDAPKGDGTYMIMGGATQPYVMHLPGLVGGLRSRFEQPSKNYKDKFIFKFPSEKISTIKVVYPMDNLSSFIIKNNDGKFQVTPILDLVNSPKSPVNLKTLSAYIAQFEMMGTEGIISGIPERDSLINNNKAVCEITITDKSGGIENFKFLPYDDIVEQEGKETNTPEELRKQNRVFVITKTGDLHTAQNRVVGGIFLGYKDFY